MDAKYPAVGLCAIQEDDVHIALCCSIRIGDILLGWVLNDEGISLEMRTQWGNANCVMFPDLSGE